MRVGLIVAGNLETFSGSHVYARQLVRHLRASGDSVEVFSLPRRSLPRQLIVGVPSRLAQQAAQLDLLLQDEAAHPALLRLNRQLRGAVPIVALAQRVRSAEPHSPGELDFYRWFERRYLASVVAFICHSETTRQAICQVLDRPELARSIIAAPGGDRFDQRVTPDVIRLRAQEPGPLRLVFVGDAIRRKGLLILLEALLKLPPGTCQLTVVGNLDAEPLYRRVVYHLFAVTNLTGVSLAGVVDDTELAAILSHSQVLVVPSEYAGSGAAYREGLGFGLPAIGTTSGVASEIIEDGVNGYLMPPNDPAALAHRLAGLAADRAKLVELSLSARDQFLAQPGWNNRMARVRQALFDWTSFPANKS